MPRMKAPLPIFIIQTIDSYTKLLLHLDNNFNDESMNPKTVSGGIVTFTSGSYKFGGYSALFSGGNQEILVTDHADLHMSNLNFTVDFWVRMTSPGQSSGSILTMKGTNAADSSGSAWYLHAEPGTYNLKLYMSQTVMWDLVLGQSCGTLTQNQWHHVAFVRNGTDIKTYLDGVEKGSTTISAGSILNDSANKPVHIGGGTWGSTYLVGNIDEFRISKGIARWVTNFTPPTLPY